MSKIKLLQVFNQYLERGGEEKSVDRIFKHGSDLFVFKRYLVNSSKWSGKNAPNKLNQLVKFFHNKDTIIDLKKYGDCDALVVHNVFPVISPSLYKYAYREKIPVIQYIHNFRPFSVGASFWVNDKVCADGLKGRHWKEIKAGSWQSSVIKSFLMSLALKKFTKSKYFEQVTSWIAISGFMKETFIEAGVPEEKIFLLRHSWDALEKLPIIEDGKYYLLLARLIPEKGIRECLEAWKKLSQQPNCPKLVIAGVGLLQKEVEEADKNYSSIEYVGFVDKNRKSELIANCRALIVPSVWWEPLGLVTYEAYDYAKPVIAAAVGGLKETVEEGVTGFHHIPGNIDSIANSVCQMEQLSSADRVKMGQSGRKWLLEKASPERWKNDFQMIVNKTIRNHQNE